MSSKLEQKALDHLLKGMQNLGCSYVVIDKDGADYTYGDAFKKDRKKKGYKYGFGALREYYGPWLKELQPGSSVEIPCMDFDIKDIQAGVASQASDIWGNGSYMTSMNREKNIVEVLRLL
jgi:hypothetical protein